MTGPHVLVPVIVVAGVLCVLLVGQMRVNADLARRVAVLEAASRAAATPAPLPAPTRRASMDAGRATARTEPAGFADAPAAEEDRQSLADAQRRLDAAFLRESRDLAGASRAEAELQEASGNRSLQASGLAPPSLDADCRRRTCRITATFAKAVDAEEWGTMFVTVAGATLSSTQMLAIPRTDGGADLEIYGTRREPQVASH